MATIGAIRHDGNFYASDGAERWFIEIRKSRAGELPYTDQARVSVDIDISGTRYTGGLRTTTSIVYITYDLYERSGEKVRLVDALAGFARNDQVEITVQDSRLTVSKSRSASSGQPDFARQKFIENLNKELTEAAEAETAAFSELEDARSRTLRAIVNRRGQAKFRAKLLNAYGGACAVTSCDLPQALEAAHISPYLGQHTNRVSNGLLLRADIHTLFDLGLIAIDPTSVTIVLSPELRASVYQTLEGEPLRLPRKQSERPSVESLETHKNWAGL